MAGLLKPMLVLLAALLLSSPVQPVAAQGPVSALEWKGMLARAQTGGVIDLGKRRVEFAGQRFQPTAPVTIRGGVFGAIVLDQWRNVTFDGATFVGAQGMAEFQNLVVADYVENLTIRNCRFTGFANDEGQLQVRGPSIRGGRNVTIERCTFEGLAGFTGFARLDGGKFLDNDLRAIREGLNIVGGRNIAIERNFFQDFRPFGGDHADGVQFFTTGLTRPGDTAARDITIRHNLILANGNAQGVFVGDELKMGGKGTGYQDFTIEENIVVGAGWHGITATNVNNATIRNNRLFRVRGRDTMDSRLAASGNAIVEGNEANAFILSGDVRQDGNKQVRESAASRIDAVIAEWKARFRKQ